jgi:hypothetical protein
MIFVLYSDAWEDRLVVRDYLVQRFGMTPVESDRAAKNIEKMAKEPMTNYVIWDCLTEVDVEGFEYVGAYSIYVARHGTAPATLYHFVVENDADLATLRRQVMAAVIHFSELSGKMSIMLRRGLEKAMQENA